MVRKSVRQQQALRRAREGARDAARTSTSEEIRRQEAMPVRRTTEADRRRLAASTCGWCNGPIDYKPRGRIPKWCSAACRQRAWEQSRAAASGRSAIEVVERRIEIPVQQPAPHSDRPQHAEWVAILQELAAQLDTGAIYDRDLPALTAALNRVLEAFERRPRVRRRTDGR
jgi:hypothetical protein